jgi:hypothetical protein
MTTYDVTQSPPSTSRPSDDRSIGELIGDLTRETTQLVRQEINLAKTEMTVKATKVAKDIGLIAAGGVLAFLGSIALVAFLILVLVRLGLGPWIAALIVGLVLAGIGGALAMSGLKKLREVDPVPHQTVEALKS